MPYKNIVFVKLEKRLLNDYRWFGMSEKAQLLYVKLMLGAAETYNKLPTNRPLLRRLLHLEWKPNVFEKALSEIKDNFPKLKKEGDFFYFEEFETKTNYNKEKLGKAQIPPKEGVDKDKEKEIDIDIEEDISQLISYWRSVYGNCLGLEQDFIQELNDKFGYSHTKNLIREFRENKFHKIPTMRNSLDEKGNIKPKESDETNQRNKPRGSIDFNKWQAELDTIK